MARINIEDRLFLDPRFKDLTQRVGDKWLALGRLVQVWQIAQFYWVKENRSGIPEGVFMACESAQDILDSGLLVKKKSRIFAKGSSSAFDWLEKCKQAGKRGGMRSSELKKMVHQVTEKTEENFNPFQPFSTHSNLLTPTPTPTPTPTLKKKTHTAAAPDHATAVRLECVFQAYPKRIGDHRKAAGLRRLAREVKTDEDLALLEAAVKNYASHCAARKIMGTEFVKQFATWASGWREWSQPNGSQPIAGAPKRERKTKAELDAELEALYSAEEQKLEQEMLNRGT